MSEEPAKPGRKPSKPNLERIIQAVVRGDYDNEISIILKAIDARNKIRQEAVLAQVREVFGDDAEVSVPKKPNPFIERAQRKSPLERLFDRVNSEEKGEGPDTAAPEDPLAHLDQVERQMSSDPPLDIERRGATISGLHSSMIGE